MGGGIDLAELGGARYERSMGAFRLRRREIELAISTNTKHANTAYSESPLIYARWGVV